ncbi:MAG: acyl--CoA ligase [Pseudomonadota bacterium]|nr:acyl--CoA ligase [Pseudomonadota bacterium]MEC8724935.1 acyl--CoA ligase [Pseudomonadota bacterium]
MSGFETIRDLLAIGKNDATAIGAPKRTGQNYAVLRELADTTVARLNELGVGRNDRVAIVLPNSPEMAAAFVTIGCGATTAPLNPAYRREEFDFYLDDLAAKALVVEEGSESPALSAAQDRNIPVFTLISDESKCAGSFRLEGKSAGAVAHPGMAEADDVALVLHTSGTTSRPKIVPLTQRNVTASAGHIAESLKLVAEDRCMNIMPLFHIHGLIAAVLSSLGAGASVHCAPGFNALRVFSWLDEIEPSWYTAVPTMHQAILSRASRNTESVGRARANLRLIRSSSSSLPPQVMKELEDTFDVPVVEAYGMTEAAHQMACNPLPPATRKPGSVGIAAGPEVAIMDESDSKLIEIGEVGEIVIRGPNVTPGYENNPEANASSFTDGWFRTGDQGVMDEEGYILITGRLKEIINRGGEKISPREVDEVLMDHPAVAQAVTFAMPHDKLGEEVAAAIVLREGELAEESDVRDFVSRHLADFKVPRRVLVLDEIPKGATGKLQRIGLAEKLGLG